MSDTKNNNDKTLGMPSSKTLTLKRPVEQGTVRQSFSHGRSKAVVVEKVKRRVIGANDGAAPASNDSQRAAAPKPSFSGDQRQENRNRPNKTAAKSGRIVLNALSGNEMDARASALANAMKRDAEERRIAEEQEILRQAEEKARAERAAEEARQAALEAAKNAAAEVSSPKESASKVPTPQSNSGAAPVRSHPAQPASTRPQSALPRPANSPSGGFRKPQPILSPKVVLPPDPELAKPSRVASAGEKSSAVRARPMDDDDRGSVRRSGSAGRAAVAVKPEAPVKTKGDDKRRGRLTVQNASEENEERSRSLASYRRRQQRISGKGQQKTPKEKISREVIIPEIITIQELANRMSERAVDVIRLLMREGMMKKITDVIDSDTAQLVAEELGHTVRRVSEADVEEGLFDSLDSEETLKSRPPVVTIMGHVDHGKTSLLDAIRSANVVSGEAGGITQHIGAYQVANSHGGRITFIDTPGHEAFTAMRARGAKATDIVVLVVAADDGVMPQTIEAINHARAAQVPMIVAINKIDKPDAKPDRVRTELLQYEVQVETLGGETLEVEVSAKQRMNLDKLLDVIQLQSEILDLKANPERAAEGIVIEAKLDKGRGPVATVLVQRGTLKVGDIVVAGGEWGKVRALLNDRGSQVVEAEPSLPVEILGFNGAPEAGDRLGVVENEARAREITEYRARQRRESAAARLGTARGSLENMMSQLKVTAGRKEFPLLIKGDVQGSVEAIIQALDKLGTDEVIARVIHAGVGGISESDVSLAAASGAAIIGFNVRAHKEARELADRQGHEIRYYNIIYDLVDDIKAAMSGLLAPERRETFLGNALIQEVFNISKVGKVAGCRITEGRVERGANVRLIRDNVVIHEGKLSTLKRFKDEVKEALVGQECGMAFEGYQDMRANDIIECYRVEEIKRSL